ncbi:hypothetical protein Q4F19_15630 [Sphingomonas sp. BIUV-7]|uniref:Uncharacterized protein n=1 Tax=Sphingomonas natans TaxID=3063330 RepID=A0ABT8YBW7_9SPHN|nr:hypothetical protein [Sphingomonas sp. BIUV-7]MDO6415822.1 hypothetical protein [Sphingomonas sp. BIUV-7]
MNLHTRAVVAASAYAIVSKHKAAGLFDHAAGRHLKIAAECRGDRLQGYDGEREVSFGGTLPDLYDQGDKAFIAYQIEGSTVRGFDRGSTTSFVANVTAELVQLYDHKESAWFAFTVQRADPE